MPNSLTFRALLLSSLTLLGAQVLAQTKYWVGGTGRWDDAAHWSTRPDGAGGAGIPRMNEDVRIDGPAVVEVADVAWCRGLTVSGDRGAVRLAGGTNAELRISGGWHMEGAVTWEMTGTVHLIKRQGGVELDLRGVELHSDLVLDGSGSWSLQSDLVLSQQRAIRVRQGTFIANGHMVSAGRLIMEGRGDRHILAGSSVFRLSSMPDVNALEGVLEPANSILAVGGQVQPWGVGARPGAEAPRDVNVCGTGPGQIPFIVDAQLTSNYNGFGVQCRGVCNATVTATVTGGSGNFTYAWLNGGPNSATWTTACGGPQIVIVTDVTQGISCPAQVNVTEPAPLGVIFFGQGTPPTCADVCDGTRTALAVGGAGQISYNWNNGAGTSSSFSQLCAGLNTLVVTDINGCTFDTTFTFNIQPIQPNLVFTPTSCFGSCDGTAEVAPTGGTGNVTITWSPIGVTGTSVTGLCAGNYSVQLVDVNGCDTTVAFTITEPPPLTIDLNSSDATCAGSCDGAADVVVSGSPGPFAFTWVPDPGTGQGSASVQGLCAGSYSVTILDQSSGCDTTLSLTIDAPPEIEVQGTVTDASCSGDCDGEVILVVSGGQAPYNFLWTPLPGAGQGTPAATGLCAGVYDVTVTDAAGCDTTVSFTIAEPPPLDVSLVITDVSCNGECDGTVTATVSGGTPTHTFTWAPPPSGGQGTPTASGLCAGTYSLLVADANGCDTLINFTVLEPPALANVPSNTNVTCGGLCDGTATATVTGGTPSYTFLWAPEPGAGQGTGTASELCAGTYTLTITDANGCELVETYVIEDAVPVQLSLQVEPATCPAICDGSAGVIATGGAAPYTYLWGPGTINGQGTPNVSALCAGAYTLTVTDALGCDTTVAFTISAPPAIAVQAVQIDASCANTCDGTIDLTVTGGTGTYTYLWTPPVTGQGSSNASGLCAGNYSVLVTSGACDTTLTFVVDEPLPLDASVIVTPPTCSNTCDAVATCPAVNGGTAPYTFLWSPTPPTGQGTDTASDLCPGSYALTITDANGCDTTIAFVIDPVPPIVVDLVVVPTGCGGTCTGSAAATATGGVGPLTYDWSPDPISGDGSPNVTGLCAGTYSLTVADAQGCDTTLQFVITTPSDVLVVPTVNDATCHDSCDGTIDLQVTGGLAPYTFLWTPEPPVGQGSGSVSGLCPGTWSVLVTDLGGCDTTLVLQVGAPAPIIPNESSTDETCNGPCDGTASVAPTGGTGPYQFLWSPAPGGGQGSPNATGLCAGTIACTITDALGCDTTVTFIILPNAGIDAGLVTSDGPCPNECGGSATVTPTGGVAPYTFVWSPDPITGQGSSTVTGLCTGSYVVTVMDAVGCDTTLSFNIIKPPMFEPNLVVQPEDCTGPCTGAAAVFPVGATPGYTFLWSPDPGTGQGTNVVTGLCAGTTYSITIGDANLCDTTLTFTVPAFVPIDATITSTPVSCTGTCDGSATISPTGGQGPYTFFWVPEPGSGQGASQGTGLCEGVYEVTIVDAANCDTTIQVLITGPAPFDIASTVQDVNCNGACDGTIGVNVTGGTAPYAYLWTPAVNGQGTPNASGLCPGSYTLLITDANGCDTLLTYAIDEPTVLVAQSTSTDAQCSICNGTAEVTIAGGAVPYTIVWTDASGAVVGTSAAVIDLCAGSYTATVTDANGCVVVEAVPVSDVDGEVLTVQDGTTSCPGDCDGTIGVSFTCSDAPCTVQWTDIGGTVLGTGNVLSGLCAGSYFVTVTNASGCISVEEAVVVDANAPILAVTSTPVTCAGECDGTAAVGVLGGQPPYTFVWSPQPQGGQGTPLATGLCAGVYDVLITGATGCDTTVSVLITEPPVLDVVSQASNVNCAGVCDGRIDLTIAGGTLPYSVIWSPVPPNGQGVLSATDLCVGTYSVLIADANGCGEQLSFTITEPAALTVQVQATSSSCGVCDGSATPTVSGGTGPYTYAWSLNGAVVSTDPLLVNACAGAYTLNVVDANNCVADALVNITDADGEVLTAINGQVTCSGDCNGVAAVSFSCSVGPCFTLWTDASGAVVAQNVLSVPDLCIGTYTVQVTNGAGCVSFIDVVVSPSQTVLPNLSSTPVSCAGVCDGAATVGPTGGTGPYTFVWSPEPGGGQNTSQATGLCEGVYAVAISDAAGCDTLVQVLILGPPALTMSALVEGTSCSGECDGSIDVLVQGGVAPYTLQWSPPPPVGQGTPNIADLCAGSYTLTVTDQNGCSLDSTWVVGSPDPLVLQGSTTLSNCGACDGTASVAIDGGTAPYFVQWTSFGAIIGTGTSISDRCAGIYIAEVTDANGCTATLLVPISDVQGEDLTTVDGITSCPTACDGTVQMSFVCTDPPCVVTWYDAGGNEIAQAVGQVDDLCPGDYFVQVVNNTGCLTVDTATVLVPDPIIANLSTTPVSCFGTCDGTATVGPTGGQGPYTFSWSPEPGGGQNTPAATGLCATTYTVTITDALGCSIVQDVLIPGPDPIDVVAQVEDASCNAVCDGSITLTPQGGTAPYTYLWNPSPPNGATGPVAEQLCAGQWQVLVTDANGCDTLLTYTIAQPALLEAVLATVDNTCHGDCLGTAEVFIQGGTAPFVVTWRDASGDVIAPDQTAIDLLCAGDYTVTITDANGCTNTQPFTIDQGQPIDPGLSVTGETCAGPCNGTAISIPTGGVGPYTFFWAPEPGTGQGTGIVSGLCAGQYSVTITDALGCDTVAIVTVAPYQAVDPGAVVTNETCSGNCDGAVFLNPIGGIGPFTYDWTPEPPNGQGGSSAVDLCPGDLSVTITDAVFCVSTFTFTITGPPAITVAVDQVLEASCANATDGAIAVTTGGGTAPLTYLWVGPNGFTSDQEDIQALAPGDHALTITDANGCDTTITVNVPSLSGLLADAGADQQFCAGPDVLLDGSASTGAVSYQWTNDQGQIVGDQAIVTLTDLPPGTYTFTLTVIDGVCTSTDQVVVEVLLLPNVNAGDARTIFLGSSTTLGGAPSGPSGSIFTWDADTTLSATDVPNPVASPSITTWYTLTVQAPNGCIGVDSVLVTVLPDVEIPSGFSPNGDGWNDTWVIDLIDLFPNCEVEIYNRWGEMLYQSVGYRIPWDGRYKGGPVPVGTYYYIVKLNDPEYPDAYTGPLTVIR